MSFAIPGSVIALLLAVSSVACVNVSEPPPTPTDAPQPTSSQTPPISAAPASSTPPPPPPPAEPTATPVPSPAPTIAPTAPPPNFDELIAAAERVPFADLVEDDTEHFFKTLYVKGRIVWLVPISSTTAWIGVEVNDRGDMIYVSHFGTDTFHEADWVELVSAYDGLYTYESVDGEDVTLPSFQSVPDEEIREAPVAGYDVPSVACTDRAYKVYGERWNEMYLWSFQEASTPADYDRGDVLDVIQAAVENITGAHNDCGLADEVNVRASYDGVTTRKAGVNRRGRCAGPGDGWNVIGFGELPEGTLAVTCTRTLGKVLKEADILINSNVSWALSLDECRAEELLEATMTHEFGHVFGLGHVKESKHGQLTMSPESNGLCHDEEISLGLGDLLGLEKLY